MARKYVSPVRQPEEPIIALYIAVCKQAIEDAQGTDELAEEAEMFLFKELPAHRDLLWRELHCDARAGTA